MVLINYLVFTAKVLGLICAIVFLISLIISIIETGFYQQIRKKYEIEELKIINEKLKTMSTDDFRTWVEENIKIED